MPGQFIIAIDPATSTGICEGRVGETPTLRTQRFRVSNEDQHEDIFGRATHFWAEFLRTRSPDLVAIEAPIETPWGATNANTKSIAYGLYGIFTGIVHCKSIRFLKAPVGTWRSYFLGHGNLKGPEAKARCIYLCDRLRWPAPNHDAAESAGIWSWACSTVEPRNAQRIEPLFARAAQ